MDCLLKQIIDAIDHVGSSYHQLVLVVGPFGAGKTTALKEIAEQRNYPYIDVSLELSRALLEFTQVQRCLHAQRLMEDIVSQAESSCVLLDNLSLLFEPSLRLDPLRLLKQLSRRRTLVAAWDGSIKEGRLLYAEPGHPEYRAYPLEGESVIFIETEGEQREGVES
ncbi:BREX-3 system P-loop-containing protein BrxF [Ammonifex thiophilus]|uniref:BREX-3 system P-loop-containing protein BrxF n=1 Tax=Ammonifex thiophilus TaxID=444093 RepID=A0A3D8P1L7_9THEO|nr:BREX-3 system P-loop-containing protein BrxF [Ammonifex thiophilus]RDV81701.1 BREX-3 system P-loop-containing protein BrxF [Ammonifex thiophilus]